MKKLSFNFPPIHSLVSLKEMYSIFWENPEYELFRGVHEFEKPKSLDGYEMPFDALWESPDSPLLYRHIIAEQLYKKKEKWADGFPRDFFHVGLLLRLAKLWMNPLKWRFRMDYDDDFKDMVIEGRVAQEAYCSEREDQVGEMIKHYQEQRILDFADESPICEEDDPQHGVIKGLHYWTIITWNNDPLFDKILEGKEYREGELAKTNLYDAAYLRKNLTIIAEHRGGECAAYFLSILRKEWKQIKIWKAKLENMSEQDMRQFEESILLGFDDLLAEWEGDTQSSKEPPMTKPQKKNSSICKSQPFETLLQCPEEQKAKVMARLHELLDNKAGKHVAMILMAAKTKESLLLDIPTEKQYKAEFSLNGTWRAVSDYLKKHTLPSGKFNEDIDHISIL